MQAIKDKLNDMNTMRKAKAEAKEDEKAEKDLAKTRVQVAHDVRMAREAEAAMDLHVQKAADRVAEHELKHPEMVHGSDGHQDVYGVDIYAQDSYGRSAKHDYSADPMYCGGVSPASGHNTASMDSNASTAGTTYTGGPPTNNNLL